MPLFNTMTCDSKVMLASRSMDAMPIATEDCWKVVRWPNKCRWRYSRALHAGFRLVFRKKLHRRAQHNFYITFISILLFLYYVYFILHFFYITWIKLNLYIKKVQFSIYS